MPIAVLQRGAVSAIDYRCEAARGSRPIVEEHRSMSISYVRSGSFGYSARGRSHDLVPGSVLVGRAGDEFHCTHDHVCGDVCLSFHLEPGVSEEIAALDFWRIGSLPPLAEVAVYGELAVAAAEGRTDVALDEAALLFAQRAVRAASHAKPSTRVSARDRKRAIEAAEWIDAHCTEEIDLASASAHAALSAFHFLRTFARVIGVTPHQYVIRARLRRAARLLVDPQARVTDVAFGCGFGDLANFTRTFGRAAGRSPATFRNFCKAPHAGTR